MSAPSGRPPDGGGLPDPRRPRSHVTVRAGWLNDPYGVTWLPDREEYLLFFQHNPRAAGFDPRMSWACCRSPDLVRWGPPETVLSPGRGDAGCWSGSAVRTRDGLQLLYTGVGGPSGEEFDVGRVVLVDPRRPERGEVVLPGPPPGVDAVHFRDPFLVADGEAGGYRLLLGAGLRGATGAVLAYSGPDLRHWRYDGILSRRREDAAAVQAADWTGSVWECPQLIEVDGAWVLIVSVAHDGVPARVMYTVGDLAWPRFDAGPWRPLWSGTAAYATTAFQDREGQACVLSWCREDAELPPPPGPPSRWAGVLGTAMRLRRDADRLIAVPHPDLTAGRPRTGVRSVAVGGLPRPVGALPPAADLTVSVRLPGGARLDCALGSQLSWQAGDGELIVRRPATADMVVPLGRTSEDGIDVRVLLDGSLAEIYTPTATAAVRVPAPDAATEVLLATSGPPLVVDVELSELPALDPPDPVRAPVASPGPPRR